MSDCIHLRERFGDRYKVRYEESYYAERGPHARGDDPWLQIIPCRRGHIFPHGGELLAASTDAAGPAAKRLKALPGVKVHQDGSDGVTVLFPVERFDQVADIMHPRRRRIVSEKERARLKRMGKAYLFTKDPAPQEPPGQRPCVHEG